MRRKGIGHDPMLDYNGGTKVYENAEKLSQDIRLQLTTPTNTVLGNPTYGSNIRRYLFKQNNLMTLELLSTEVFDILSSYDGIVIQEVRSVMEDSKVFIYYDILYDTQNYNNMITLEGSDINV